ncbi:RNA polymerase sigma factor [Lacipirellula limnantheis]|uniref:RNA polymerase sigma factor n=1 Tax=Lacipirellula limnantheis TaxID=2528024 RepID=A0A517TRS1_9BACT|nr:sigma-70 family RNA polymerase sigma factor [Lacipirellula limnantheis]QDT71074.1 RNA polymerase sigma factor [Lacipirellula limnantheis]
MPSVDATLIAEMLDRHGAALALYARQWTSAADDCVQEALIELARQPKAPENPAAWLYRVVRNRALNAVRAEGRRNAHELFATEQRVARQPTEANPADAAELNDNLATLDAAAREIVVLRVWGGLAWQEIGELVGESKSSAQRTYVQALEQLRRHWEPRIH